MKVKRKLSLFKISQEIVFSGFLQFSAFGNHVAMVMAMAGHGHGHGWLEPNFGNALAKAHMKAEMIALTKASMKA